LISVCIWLATDGIGLEYAKKFAEMGYSLLLISRNDEKLQKTRSDILLKCQKCSYIKTIAVDFTDCHIYDIIKCEIDKLEVIDVLVNSVGMNFEVGEYFTRI